MNNINPIYSFSSCYPPVFKQKTVKSNVATNPINCSVSMCGINALASYNSVSSNTEKLEIPILSPIDIPDNADKIGGNKTFNKATGEITVTQKGNDVTKRYIYDNGSYTYEILDNKDNRLFVQSKNITNEGVYTKIIKEQPNDNKINGVQALYKDGNLEHVSKYIIPSKEASVGYPYEDTGYNAVSKTYYIEKCDSNNKTLIQYFDNNLKPISVNEYRIRNLITDGDYMETVHEALIKRDVDGDGEVSVDEIFAHNFLIHKYPDLGEEDRNALIKNAVADGNINVNDEEFVRWLEGYEHGKILEDFKIREVDEIRTKRNSK